MTTHIHVYLGKKARDTVVSGNLKGFSVKVDGSSIGNIVAKNESEALSRIKSSLTARKLRGNMYRFRTSKHPGIFDEEISGCENAADALAKILRKISVVELKGSEGVNLFDPF